jgi:hypothetical protein
MSLLPSISLGIPSFFGTNKACPEMLGSTAVSHYLPSRPNMTRASVVALAILGATMVPRVALLSTVAPATALLMLLVTGIYKIGAYLMNKFSSAAPMQNSNNDQLTDNTTPPSDLPTPPPTSATLEKAAPANTLADEFVEQETTLQVQNGVEKLTEHLKSALSDDLTGAFLDGENSISFQTQQDRAVTHVAQQRLDTILGHSQVNALAEEFLKQPETSPDVKQMVEEFIAQPTPAPLPAITRRRLDAIIGHIAPPVQAKL